MATLKHISSKNSNYTAIEAYLVYQHDEFTGKQLLDEHGKPKLRESYLLDTLECGDFSFATACLLANRKYGKNTQHGDIKSHQYIISFDPRDAADNGLTIRTILLLWKPHSQMLKTRQHNNRHMVCCLPMSKGACV